MDTKRMLEKLVKIAENQQKIINRIAQNLPVGDPSGGAEPLDDHQPPPNHLDPLPTQKDEAQVLFDALDPLTKDSVDRLYSQLGDIYVKFKDGRKSQAVYNSILRTLQNLTNSGRIQRAHALKVSE